MVAGVVVGVGVGVGIGKGVDLAVGIGEGIGVSQTCAGASSHVRRAGMYIIPSLSSFRTCAGAGVSGIAGMRALASGECAGSGTSLIQVRACVVYRRFGRLQVPVCR